MSDIAATDPSCKPVRRGKDRISRQTRNRFAIDTQTLIDADGRLRVVRRLKDIASQIATDQSGADRCSEARLQLIRRFATACVLAEQVEARLADGGELDAERFALVCSVLCRLSSRIGLSRLPRTVEGLGSYLERKYAAPEEADAEVEEEEALS